MDTKIEEVKQDIRKVQQQIHDVEGQLTKAATEADVAYWRKEKEQLSFFFWQHEESLLVLGFSYCSLGLTLMLPAALLFPTRLLLTSSYSSSSLPCSPLLRHSAFTCCPSRVCIPLLPFLMASTGRPTVSADHLQLDALASGFKDELVLPEGGGADTDGIFVAASSGDAAGNVGKLEGRVVDERVDKEPRQKSFGSNASSHHDEVFGLRGVEGPGKTVGKVEARRNTVGKVEGTGNEVGKCEGENVGKVEGMGNSVGKAEGESVGKLEEMGQSVGKSEGDNVGKVEGMGQSVGKAEKESVGKMEEMGQSVGKAEGESVGKVEEMGQSVGKSEGESVGKVEEMGQSVGKSEGESVGKVEGPGKSLGKVEGESVGKVGRVAETGDRVEKDTVGKSECGKSVGKSQEQSVGKVDGAGDLVGKATGENKMSQNRESEVGKNAGKVENEGIRKSGGEAKGSREMMKLESAGAGQQGGRDVGKVEGKGSGTEKIRDNKMEETSVKIGSKDCVIAMAAKSAVEEQFVERFTTGGAQDLKLPEGATLVAYQQGLRNAEAFHVVTFMDCLQTHQFGRLLLYAQQLPSTHTLLAQNFHSFPGGTVSVADVQYQGKGRAGNTWESPKGCLMFSFTIQMIDGRAVPFLQYVVSLAVIDGIEALCTTRGLQPPEVKIKWPNDLYSKGLKVGGVLCTSSYSAKKFNIVVGVGLNVGNWQPTTCLDALVQELNEDSPKLARDELLAAIIGKFEELFKVFSTQGFFALESKYYQRWLHSGQTVVLEEKEEGHSEISKTQVTIQGLTPSGYLRAVDDSSEAYELHPDGNSFDFLKGLVRKKM